MKINFNFITSFIKNVDENPLNQGSKQFHLESEQLKSTLQNINSQVNIMSNLKLPQLSNMQSIALLKDLLNMPKEWTQLLQQLVSGNDVSGESLQIILSKNPKINLENLTLLLTENSKGLLDKIVKLNISLGNHQQGMEQLRDVMKIAGNIIPAVSITQPELIRNTMQLYLPYLPVNDPSPKALDEVLNGFEQKKPEQGETLFLITTKNIGKFKVLFYSIEKTVHIEITNIAKDFDKEIETFIKKQIIDECSKISLNSNLFYKSITAETNTQLENPENQLYIINTDNTIISLVMLQLLSKIIFEIAEKASLLETRKNKL